jgi:8-oxo-dGTP pyrophosphatase MutT (NUDIX family)
VTRRRPVVPRRKQAGEGHSASHGGRRLPRVAGNANRVVQGGAIVVRHDARTPRVLVVRSSDELRWLFPKGHVEPGETRCETAAREAREEAGVVADHGRFVGRASYERGRRVVEISYYRLDYLGDAPADESRDTRWCTPAQARRLLSFPELVSFLDRALGLPA